MDVCLLLSETIKHNKLIILSDMDVCLLFSETIKHNKLIILSMIWMCACYLVKPLNTIS